MELSEEILREARSQLARESVNKRWARMNAEERREAVKPANAARRMMKGKPRAKRVSKQPEELKRLMRLMRN